MSPSVLMVTPTHRGDLERLRLLVESRLRLGITIPHVVIADTEAVDLVTAGLPSGSTTVIPTDQVLPTRIEQRRRHHYRRRDLRRWATGAPVAGWAAQQLVKLAFAERSDADVLVFVDSDVAFVRMVSESDFVSPDGVPYLFESHEDNAETAAWAIHAMQFLGVGLQGTPVRLYIHNPVVMNKNVAAALVAHIRARHRGHWMEAILGSGSTEYQLYGVYAVHVDRGSRVERRSPLPAVNFWTPESGDVGTDLYERVQAARAKVVGIQSTLRIPPDVYRPILERIWDESGP